MATSEGKSFFASGNISPAVFVKLVSTDNFAVAQCQSLADTPYGISQQGTFDPPGFVGATAYAANAPPPAESILVFHEGDVCLLQAGTAGFNAGDRLGSDVNGLGVTVTSGAYGAIAFQTTAAGALGRVEVQIGKL